jgi:2-dehydropantoate 2-reductase
MGSGGLGGFFGGALARSGADLTFIARGPHLTAIREAGLAVESALLGDFTVRTPATDRPAEVEPVDLVLFCVKGYDLDEAAERMRPMVHPRTIVVPLLSGIDIAVRLGRYVAPQQVLAGVSYVSARLERPGLISQSTGSRMLLGELAGGSSPRLERLVELFRAAGLQVEPRTAIRVDLWEKFMGLCADSLLALTRLPVGPILACPELAELYRVVMLEVGGLASACGVDVPAAAVDRRLATLSDLAPDTPTAQSYDLLAGRRIELDSLNGTAVRLGRERGVPTPLNFAIYAALKPYANGPPALPD